MDREIPKEVRNKERNKKIIRYGGMGAAGIVVISVLISLMRTGVKEKDIVFSQVRWFLPLRRLSTRPSTPVFWKYIRKVATAWI